MMSESEQENVTEFENFKGFFVENNTHVRRTQANDVYRTGQFFSSVLYHSPNNNR